MRPSLHFLDESLSIKSKTNCSHLSNCKATIEHMISPTFHCCLEMREISRCLVLGNILHDLSNVPKVPPLGIERRRIRSLSAVLFTEIVDNVVVFPCFLCILGCCSNLEVIFRENVGNRLAFIELLRPFIEKLFHLVQKLVVLFGIYSWIFDDETAIFMKRFSYGFAIFGIISRLFEEICDVDDWDD